MKLRNKKTGEIVEAESCNSTTGMIGLYYVDKDDKVGTKDCFETLAELNEEWEDYGPLIEDEVVRNIIRVWSKNKGIHKVVFDRRFFRLKSGNSIISVWGKLKLEDKQTYTIKELCGEGNE